MYTGTKDPMTVPFRSTPPEQLDELNSLDPVDEKVSSMLGIILVVFAMLLLAADLSATVLPKFYHRHQINQVAVSPVHREVDWEKNTLHKLQAPPAGVVKP